MIYLFFWIMSVYNDLFFEDILLILLWLVGCLLEDNTKPIFEHF